MLPAGGNPEYYAEGFLGSSRVMTQNNGTVCYDADFDPYGSEHVLTNSCPSTNAYKFESNERDTETGNDDFGARYYTSRFGRWLSADWSNVPVPVPYANLTNPQTLNLYAMVSDDPESFADLDGHIQNASQGLSAESGGINPGTGELTADGLSCESHPESCESAAEQQQQAQETTNAERRAAIAATARADEGDTSMPYTPGHATCNLFVQREIAKAVAPKPEVKKADGTIGAPSAAEWAGSKIPGWRFLKPGEARNREMSPRGRSTTPMRPVTPE